MNRSLQGILGAGPELLAAGLTAVAILTPYYTLQERTPPMDSFVVNDQKITPDALEIENRDGAPYVVTSPLPEYITVSSELWDEAEVYDPEVDGDTGLEPPWLWLEEILHADSWTLHVEASNVICAYRLLAGNPAGDRLLQLVSWGEK